MITPKPSSLRACDCSSIGRKIVRCRQHILYRNSDTEQQKVDSTSPSVNLMRDCTYIVYTFINPERYKKTHILKFITLIVATLLIIVATKESTEIYEAEAREPIKVVQIIEVKTDNPEVEQKIREAFPDNYEVMLAVFQAESELYEYAHNPEKHYDRNGNVVCESSRGIAQIACVNYQGDLDDLYDVDINLEVARQVYDTQGIKAWGSFTDKRYLAYIN